MNHALTKPRRTALHRWAIIGLLLPGAAAAGAFDGLWRANPAAECVHTGADGGALKIKDDVLYGVGTECRMTLPVNVRDMDAVLFDMACRGTDMEWSDRAMFMHAADGGLFLIWNGFAYKYEACDEDAAAGAVTTADDIGITD